MTTKPMTVDEARAWREAVDARLLTLETKVAALASAPRAQAAPSGGVATDADLDGEYGNPEVRFDPKRWTGDSYVGLRYSACPPAYLETMAGFLDWCAENDATSDNEKYRKNARYKTLDAARARGWARRNASAGTDAQAEDYVDGEAPF